MMSELIPMKTRRHAAVLQIVRSRQVHSQEELRDLLHAENIDGLGPIATSYSNH